MALAYAVTPDQARQLALEFIFVGAETVLPHARELVQERFGARIGAIYSCEEVGTIATQCPHSDGYHVVAENILVEILNADGWYRSPPARLVRWLLPASTITPCRSFATPLGMWLSPQGSLSLRPIVAGSLAGPGAHALCLYIRRRQARMAAHLGRASGSQPYWLQ